MLQWGNGDLKKETAKRRVEESEIFTKGEVRSFLSDSPTLFQRPPLPRFGVISRVRWQLRFSSYKYPKI